MYFVVSNHFNYVREEDFWILSWCISWKSQVHTLYILESLGKIPLEEGMKSDGEQGMSGEWEEMTVDVPFGALLAYNMI